MHNSYGYFEQPRDWRPILIICAIALLIVGIAIWGIIAFIGSHHGDETTLISEADNLELEATAADGEASTATTDAKNGEAISAIDEPSTTDDNQSDDQSTADQTATAENSEAPIATIDDQPATDSIPRTGPTDLAPLALLAGSSVTCLLSRRQAKNSAP